MGKESDGGLTASPELWVEFGLAVGCLKEELAPISSSWPGLAAHNDTWH